MTTNLFGLISASLSLIGSYFFARSLIFTSANEIAALSSTYIGHNKYLVSSFSQQKADGVIGFVLTSLGGFIGLWALFVKISIIVSAISVSLSFFLITLCFLSSHFLSTTIKEHLVVKSGLVLFVNHSRKHVLEGRKKFDELVDDATRFGLTKFIKIGKTSPEILEHIYLTAKEEELARIVMT